MSKTLHAQEPIFVRLSKYDNCLAISEVRTNGDVAISEVRSRSEVKCNGQVKVSGAVPHQTARDFTLKNVRQARDLP